MSVAYGIFATFFIINHTRWIRPFIVSAGPVLSQYTKCFLYRKATAVGKGAVDVTIICVSRT